MYTLFNERWKRAKVMRGSTGEIKGKRDAADDADDEVDEEEVEEEDVAVACDLESSNSIVVKGSGRLRKKARPGEGVAAASVEEEELVDDVARCSQALRCPGRLPLRTEVGDSALHTSSVMVTRGVPGMGRRAVGAPSFPRLQEGTRPSFDTPCL